MTVERTVDGFELSCGCHVTADFSSVSRFGMVRCDGHKEKYDVHGRMVSPGTPRDLIYARFIWELGQCKGDTL